jgi:hypothetical protein
MPEVTKSNLYPCAHCDQSGTCKNGKDGTSCSACIKKNELKNKKHSGLLCGACGGIGLAEPMTERMNKRTKPILAMSIVFLMLLLVSVLALFKFENLKDVLGFAGLLIGSITGYYFSSNRENNV